MGCGDRRSPANPQSLPANWLLELALASVVSLVSLSASSSRACSHFLHCDFFPLFISIYTPPFSFLLIKIQAFNQDLMHVWLLQDILSAFLFCQKPFICSGQMQQMLEQNLVLLPAKQQGKASTALLWGEELFGLMSSQMTFPLPQFWASCLLCTCVHKCICMPLDLKNSVAGCLQWNF